jgi:acyl-homoserine lactone acylase PvdQ
MYPGCEGP